MDEGLTQHFGRAQIKANLLLGKLYRGGGPGPSLKERLAMAAADGDQFVIDEAHNRRGREAGRAADSVIAMLEASTIPEASRKI